MSETNRVVLDAAELLGQSGQLQSLKGEYESMFQNVASILNEMNEGWSENLANNFSTKITTAQKSFSKIVEMLECGEVVAKEAANSFEDVNKVMASTLSSTFSNLFEEVTGYKFGAVIDAVMDPQTWQNVWEDMQSLEKWEEYKEELCHIGDFFGDLGKYETATFGTAVLSTSGEILNAGGEVLGNFLEVFGGTNPYYNAYEESMTTDFVDAIVEGNYVEAVVGGTLYTLEGAIGFTADAVVDGLGGIGNALGVDDMIQEIEASTGWDVDGTIEAVADGIGQGVSDAIDWAVDGIGKIEDWAQEGISNIVGFLW